jgi:hypothetical protein
MSSITHPQSELPSEHEELVAYLDGELGPAECRRVEERLANDAEYRQHLRDLDQAWEALGALPSTAVDDGFARTTIELACAAAEEDLSQRNSLVAVENRGRRRWWIAGAVAAAVMGFVMVRGLAVHRNNKFLADLPVITQINALSMVHDVDFLRQLAQAGFGEDIEQEEGFKRELNDFTKANSASLDERREWANSLAPEKKADLADRAREFAELHQKPEETERLRQLADDIRNADDAAALRSTLVAYGHWMSQQGAGDLYQLRRDFEDLSPRQHVDAVLRMAKREKEQVVRKLSDENKAALRSEIFALAKQKRAEYAANPPAGKANSASNNERTAFSIFIREVMQNDEDVLQRLEEKLSPDAREHLNRISRWQPAQRRWQMWAWIHDATHKKPTPEQLERFFASDAVPADVRQKLLDMPKDRMDVALERLYWKTELGIEEPWPLIREFGERGRGQRTGPRGQGPPDGERRGPGPQRGPDGRPPDRRLPPPDGRFDREPLRPGPDDGPRRPRPEDGPERGLRRPPDDEGVRDGRPGPPLPPPRPTVEQN